MKISKKALSLLLALTMIVSTFASTAAFAADDATWDSNFDSGILHGHITDSNFTADKDSGAVEVTCVDSGNNGVVIVPQQVTLKDSNYNVTAIADDAFINTEATSVNATFGGKEIALTAEGENSETPEGYVALAAIDGGTITAKAIAVDGYDFKGWYQTSDKETSISTTDILDLTNVANCNLTAKFGKSCSAKDQMVSEISNLIADLPNSSVPFTAEDKAKAESIEALLEQATKDIITKTVAAPVTTAITNDENKITEAPVVSALLLAAGIKGDETVNMEVKFEMEQIVPTGSGSVLAFNLSLMKGAEDIHQLAVPVTVTFKFPTSFEKNPNSTYTIRHDRDDGSFETLPLNITDECGMFTTSSFSTFTVIETKDSSDPNSDSGSIVDPNSNNNTSTDPSTSTATFVSDTTVDFNVKNAYQFKITSKNGQVPTLVVGTAGVFETQLVNTIGNDYYFKLISIGTPDTKAGIYINGVKLLVATVASDVKSDTNLPFSVKSAGTYIFKITAESKPTFVSGTSSAFETEFVNAVGKDYFFKVTAVGAVGTASGFYINNQKTPVAIATVS